MVDGEQPGQSSNKDVKRSKDSAPAFVAQNVGAPEDLPIPDSPLWAILDELATKDEAELRRILRPHDEAGLSWDMDSAVILLRERLDAALEVLTYFEINIQTGRQAPTTFFEFAGNPDLGRFPALPSLRRLFASEAFLHYCDSYLYFGVRFLAERISPAVPAVRRLMTQYQQAEQNWRPFALSTPPDVQPEANIAEAFFAGRPVSNDEQAALYFLDGFFDRPLDYELWLGGLLAEYRSDQMERFVKITIGLESWVRKRVAFYFRLAKLDDAAALGASAAPGAAAATQQTTLERMAGEFGPSFAPGRVFGESASSLGRGLKVGDYWRPPGGWTMKDPAAARFGLADLYWIARILRASVSAAGTVRYEGNSWLHLMRFSANVGLDKKKADEIFQYEEVLRSVFDYCCELVQNAIAVTAERIRLVVDPSSAQGRPEETKRWRFVFDEELETIAEQRLIRRYRDLPTSETDAGRSAPRPVADEAPPPADPRPPSGDSWSTRLRTGKQPGNLLGIAFSGGGIRSATFNLGVLQGLQELDLLQQIDYISSVSGGGFVASWLVANVRRSAHWLGRVTDWNAPIAHLRAYSNYLAPKTGILSADTWTLAATWIRNAFFIQITGIAWLFTLLLLALLGKNVFIPLPDHPHGKLLILSAAVLSAVLMSGTTFLQLLQLSDKKREKSWTSRQVRWLTVLPAWTGAFLTSALLWQQARLSPTLSTLSRYSEILKVAFGEWNILLFISLLVFTMLALVSLQRWRVHAFWIAPFCTAVIYLGVSGVFYLDRQLDQQQTANAVWCSYIFSPILLLAAYTLGVVVFIGLTGRNSKEGIREWWTRLGAWLGVYALGAAAITAVAAFGPQVVGYAWQRLNTSVKWAGLASWAGTVVWGLISGNSSKTNGEKNKSNALQYVAVTAGALYIIGFVILASTLLYTLLWKIFSPDGTPYDDFLGAIDSLPHRHAVLLGCFAGLLGLGALFSHFFEINIFGLNQFYRNRLVRCYLGASRLAPGVRQPNRFTGFDSKDDLKLYKLKEDPHLDASTDAIAAPSRS